MSRFLIATLVTGVGAAAFLLTQGRAVPGDALAALLLLYVVSFGLGICFLRLQYFGPATCRGPGGDKVCALTFDDGPDATATGPLLALLERERIHAAFFLIGARVREHPDLAVRIVNEGHLLGNHTQRHCWWTNFMSTAALLDEVARAQVAIQSVTGVLPRYFRPPVGLTNPAVFRVMRRLGLQCIGWNVRSLDRGAISASRVVRRVRRGLREGCIILLHDGGVDSERLLSIVEQVVVQARSEGFRFVRLDELLGHQHEVAPSRSGTDRTQVTVP